MSKLGVLTPGSQLNISFVSELIEVEGSIGRTADLQRCRCICIQFDPGISLRATEHTNFLGGEFYIGDVMEIVEITELKGLTIDGFIELVDKLYPGLDINNCPVTRLNYHLGSIIRFYKPYFGLADETKDESSTVYAYETQSAV